MFYSSLFDTATTSEQELELGLACALLQFHALMPQPPVLTALHAINSTLILDKCAGDQAFLALIEMGAIRFRARYDGTPPKQLLKDVVSGAKDLYLRGWGDEVDKDQEVRRALSASLDDFKEERSEARMGPEISARLRRAKDLFRAIETGEQNCGPLMKEESYKSEFKTVFEEKVQRAQRDATPVQQSLLTILQDLAGEGTKHNTRSDVYRAIDERQCSDELKRQARTFTDAFYNQRVADSLGLGKHYHSAYADDASRLAHDGETLSADIVHLDEKAVSDLTDLRFSWHETLAALTKYGPVKFRGLASAKQALDELAHRYSKRSIWVPVISEKMTEELGKEMLSLSIGGAVVAIGGTFGAMLLGVVGATLGGVLGIGGQMLIHKIRFQRAKTILTSVHNKILGVTE